MDQPHQQLDKFKELLSESYEYPFPLKSFEEKTEDWVWFEEDVQEDSFEGCLEEWYQDLDVELSVPDLDYIMMMNRWLTTPNIIPSQYAGRKITFRINDQNPYLRYWILRTILTAQITEYVSSWLRGLKDELNSSDKLLTDLLQYMFSISPVSHHPFYALS